MAACITLLNCVHVLPCVADIMCVIQHSCCNTNKTIIIIIKLSMQLFPQRERSDKFAQHSANKLPDAQE